MTGLVLHCQCRRSVPQACVNLQSPPRQLAIPPALSAGRLFLCRIEVLVQRQRPRQDLSPQNVRFEATGRGGRMAGATLCHATINLAASVETGFSRPGTYHNVRLYSSTNCDQRAFQQSRTRFEIAYTNPHAKRGANNTHRSPSRNSRRPPPPETAKQHQQKTPRNGRGPPHNKRRLPSERGRGQQPQGPPIKDRSRTTAPNRTLRQDPRGTPPPTHRAATKPSQGGRETQTDRPHPTTKGGLRAKPTPDHTPEGQARTSTVRRRPMPKYTCHKPRQDRWSYIQTHTKTRSTSPGQKGRGWGKNCTHTHPPPMPRPVPGRTHPKTQPEKPSGRQIPYPQRKTAGPGQEW